MSSLYEENFRAVANSLFCRLRRREGRMKRGHLALRQRAVALCTPTSTRRLPDLATALRGVCAGRFLRTKMSCGLSTKSRRPPGSRKHRELTKKSSSIGDQHIISYFVYSK